MERFSDYLRRSLEAQSEPTRVSPIPDCPSSAIAGEKVADPFEPLLHFHWAPPPKSRRKGPNRSYGTTKATVVKTQEQAPMASSKDPSSISYSRSQLSTLGELALTQLWDRSSLDSLTHLSLDDLKKAHRRAVKKTHPDHHPQATLLERQRLTEAFIAIQQAHQLIKLELEALAQADR